MSTNSMSTGLKRFFFWSLFILFVIDAYFVYTSGTENDPSQSFLTEGAKNGKLLFQEHNCISCHQLYGLGGYMGPDLTNVMSAPGKGEIYVKTLIQNGTQRMPNLHLPESDVKALTEYLNYVDKTGISPVRNFEINLDGTITQKDVR